MVAGADAIVAISRQAYGLPFAIAYGVLASLAVFLGALLNGIQEELSLVAFIGAVWLTLSVRRRKLGSLPKSDRLNTAILYAAIAIVVDAAILAMIFARTQLSDQVIVVSLVSLPVYGLIHFALAFAVLLLLEAQADRVQRHSPVTKEESQ